MDIFDGVFTNVTIPAPMFEYLILVNRPKQTKLNELGKQGWELITVIDAEFIFKRKYYESK